MRSERRNGSGSCESRHRRAVHVERVDPLAVEVRAVADFADAVPHRDAQAFALARDDGSARSVESQPSDGDDVRLPDGAARAAHLLEQAHDAVVVPACPERAPSSAKSKPVRAANPMPMEFESLDGYLLDGAPSKAEVVRELLRAPAGSSRSCALLRGNAAARRAHARPLANRLAPGSRREEGGRRGRRRGCATSSRARAPGTPRRVRSTPRSIARRADGARDARRSSSVTRRTARRALDASRSTSPGGTTLAVVGPSGAGKTTLLRAIAGLVPVRGGDVLLGGESVAALPPQERRIALVVSRRRALRQHDACGRICASRSAARGEDARRGDRDGAARRQTPRPASAAALRRRAPARVDRARAALGSSRAAAGRAARAPRSVAAPLRPRRGDRRPPALRRSDPVRHARSRRSDERRRRARRARRGAHRGRRRTAARL